MESTQPTFWNDPTHTAVRPTSPAVGWVGGKSRLASRIIGILQEIPHQTYAEPFVGMGGIFFRRDRRPPCEVINDRSRDVTNFFRILREHYVAFVDTLRYQITTRAEFERLLKVDPDTQTDLQRAGRFLYLQRLAFGGRVEGRSFGVSLGEPGAFDVSRLVPALEELHDRLKGVIIECLPYQDLLERYDRPETLFYLDPPYHGTEQAYGKGLFSPDDFAPLAAQLERLKGRFVLSINATPRMREIFGRFQVEEVEVTYSLNGPAPMTAKELIVRGPS